jgi:hypothetical protein
MRIPRTLAPALVALALALPLAGCPTMGEGTASKELSSAQFDDIPVPRGFAIDLGEGRSFSYAEGGGGPGSIRLGRLEYSGLGDVDEILAWYSSEMPRPIHGWTRVAGEEGSPVLTFKKGGERCIVSVKTEGAAIRVVVERNTGAAASTDEPAARSPER